MMMKVDIPAETRAKWEVPAFDVPLWLGRQNPWCVVIPVINEGQRIKKLLDRMATLNVADIADIVVVDGGSTDGSLELDLLRCQGVRGLLVKKGLGKLSAQLRCAYAFALDQGYEGIVTIDGNDKDDPEAIPRFVDALKMGVDFVQASRFITGGVAENTPRSRDFGIRFIHAPALSLSSGFHWTDTTQGFRAYSRRMLLDPAINPFRNIFSEYELLAYLSHRAPQMGYRCLEIATTRSYPKGEVPTKISAVRGNLKVLGTLFFACAGVYNMPGFADRRLPNAWPIAVTCILGFLFSVLAFFPGWMSPDSIAQYSDASEGIYRDWHPVLMAWWWSKLDHIYSGPALMLMQNLLLYWGGWGLMAKASRRWMGWFAYIIPILGFWPGLLFPLGQIWKDIVFASAMLFAWSLLVNAYAGSRQLRLLERGAVILLSVFGFGVKTNGLVILPFLFGFWIFVEGWQKKSLMHKILLNLGLVATVAAAAISIVPSERVIKTSPFQYTQTYDLLAISVRTGQVWLPSYITKRVGEKPEELRKLYWTGGNNALFYNTAGTLAAANASELADLKKLWTEAVRKYPGIYLAHRINNFMALLRWGESTTAVVASPTIVTNPFGFSFNQNKFSYWLAAQADRHPWMFFPWIYLAMLLVSMGLLFILKLHQELVFAIGGSAITFIFPHIFIAPSADYRYLFYAYPCALILLLWASFALFSKVKHISMVSSSK